MYSVPEYTQHPQLLTSPVTSLISCVNISPHCTDLVQGDKGKTGNYYSEIEEDEYEEMKDAEEYEEMDGEGETRAQVISENNDRYMHITGGNTQPQPMLLTSKQLSSNQQPYVEVNKGAVVDKPEDQSQNVDQDPDTGARMTKSPAYLTFHQLL